MKKTVFLIAFLMLGFSGKLSAAITANLTMTMTASTSYPAYYDVNLHISSMANSGCYGKFSIALERKQLYPTVATVWSSVTPTTIFPNHTTPEPSYSGSAIIQQLPGTRFAYRVTVTFNPSTGGPTCATAPNEVRISNEVTCEGAKPDFRLGVNNDVPPTNGDPINVCINGLFINPTYCELEPSYFMEVTECNRWWSTSGNYNWNKWYLTPATNASMDLQAEIFGGGTFTGSISKIMLGGTITAGPLAGQDRYYRVTVATGNPVWFSKAALVRIDQGCRVTIVDVRESNEMPESAIVKLYPNPVKDNLTIHLENNQLIKKVSFFDMNNNLVKEELHKGKSNTTETNIASLKKGLYFIAIETTDGMVRSKIVKE